MSNGNNPLTWDDLVKEATQETPPDNSQAFAQETAPSSQPSRVQSSTLEERISRLEQALAVQNELERVAKKYNIPKEQVLDFAQRQISLVEKIALASIAEKSLNSSQPTPPAPPEGKEVTPESAQITEEQKLLLEAHREGLGVGKFKKLND